MPSAAVLEDASSLLYGASVRNAARRHLWVALIIAAAVHAFVILELHFELTKPKPAPPSTMEITLVAQRAQQTPKDADYLAQASQLGGGDSAVPSRPTTPLPAPFPALEPVPTGPASSMPAVEVRAERPVPEVMVAAQAPQAPAVSRPQPEPHTADNAATAREVAVATDSPTAAELIARSLQIASLSADISPHTRAHSKRPRHKYINAHTQAYKYASYMEAWRAKVERVGNLNYPQEARQGRLSGSLILDVALDADGNVLSAEVVRSSGYKALDDGAVRIVYLAAPFAPLPKAIREETDVLHITRTWQFRDGDHLSSE